MADRYENEAFFAVESAYPGPPTVPESVFYAGRTRPPPETGIAVTLAASPMRFAATLFLVGWAGILFQASFLQQVVFGAPVFEELAKVGLALLVVSLLRLRTLWLRMPLAWLSGASFGVLEHFLTYAEEDATLYATRVAFHALATGLSMLFYHAFEPLPDVRTRWASTIPSTLAHWANNFGAVVFGVSSLLVDEAGFVAMAWSALITIILTVGTFAALLTGHDFDAAARRTLALMMPRFGVAPTSIQEVTASQTGPVR